MMPHRNELDGDGEGADEFSGSESDDALDEDMEALRRACMMSGTDPNDLNTTDQPTSPAAVDSDSEDDLQLVQNITNRLALSNGNGSCEPLTLQALCALSPAVSDDDDDDFEVLRCIQRRFSAYDMTDTKNSGAEDLLWTPTRVHSPILESIDDTSDNLFANIINECRKLPDSAETCDNIHLSANGSEVQQSSSDVNQSDAHKSSTLPQLCSNFPTSAQFFIDAIKKNRSYQKFIRSKLTQIEARLEENKKLKDRVKILKDFQVSCRKLTGRELSRKKDPRFKLISSHLSEDKKSSVIRCGPAENSRVANYRMVLEKYPLPLHRKTWSNTEKENLGKGLKQQFQDMVLQLSIDQLSGAEESRDMNSLDDIYASVKNIDITPAMIREFLPKVNWNQLASMYVKGRSGAECQAQWLNCADPIVNHCAWTNEEEKSLLLIIQEKGISNWYDIAVSLGTSRTPFKCLARYQRSLNACILKREWTEDEDEQLRAAVEKFGESNWQSVASTLKGRTGPQCSNRWRKTLHPMRQRKGRFSPDEDKRLRVATMLFGARNWNKIAQFVPGRTQVQCRERWVNSLDPSVNHGEWTEEEDLRLEAAIEEHGYCWTKVAACMPSRTDNQCLRRWKSLHPHKLHLLREARKMQKIALIGNFVDRESERPSIGPNDFLPVPLLTFTSEPDNVKKSRKRKRNASVKTKCRKEKETAPGHIKKKKRSKRARKVYRRTSDEFSGDAMSDPLCSSENYLLPGTVDPEQDHLGHMDSATLTTYGKEVDVLDGNNLCRKKLTPRRTSNKKPHAEMREKNNFSFSHETQTVDDEFRNLASAGSNNNLKQYQRRKKYSKSSPGECSSEVAPLEPVRSNKLKPSRRAVSKNLVPVADEDDDDVTLASLVRNKSTLPYAADQDDSKTQRNVGNTCVEDSNTASKQQGRKKKCSEPLRRVSCKVDNEDGCNSLKPGKKSKSKLMEDEDDMPLCNFIRKKKFKKKVEATDQVC